MKNFICYQHGEELAILNIENIKICGSVTKSRAKECNLFDFSPMSAEYLQKI